MALRERLEEGRVTVRDGKPWPLGANPDIGGVNFAIFSRHATAVSLLLFDSAGDTDPALEVALDPLKRRTGDVWHCFVEGCRAGDLYLYRVSGPYEPENGHRFNDRLAVLDPYAYALTGCENLAGSLGFDSEATQRDLVPATRSNLDIMPKCIVIRHDFDWEGDRPLKHPAGKTIIYEAHVRGLTAHASSGVERPGTYRGIIEHIPYLKHLGITSLELLPVQEFDAADNPRTNPHTGEPLRNYWGYNTIAYFAPKQSYAADTTPGGQVNEFKEMVRELHRAGIEVILDVVFNHTGEGAETGPTLSFRGIDNSEYYILDSNKRYYKNFSGCGNTVNCNNPVVRSFIVHCLRYWVTEMHVDGFRFDLGSILSRDREGNLMDRPPILERIAEDPVLRDTRIIAEAWDAAGAYQVGSFPGGRWAEWNDRFRDAARRFWRGEPWVLGDFATRLAGSSDLYHTDGRSPFHSINYVTCHDGFTLHDLVSYSRKHNYANGEGNRDGHSNELGHNYGVEGETELPGVRHTRACQVRNLLISLFVSQGIPMMLSGDELRNTQNGNNNAYCHDGPLTWIDYTLDGRLGEEKRAFRDFVGALTRFRRMHPSLYRSVFFSGTDRNGNSRHDLAWYSGTGEPMEWRHADGCLGMLIDGSDAPTDSDEIDDDILVLLNATTAGYSFALPAPRAGWRLVVDTSAGTATEFRAAGEESAWPGEHYPLSARSAVILVHPRRRW